MDAALDLFAEHGVSGTSLQQIADHLGVTKAAVYYQFHAKEDIVVAVIASAFVEMSDFLDRAEAASTPTMSSRIALEGLVDLIIGHRQAMAALAKDPEIGRVVEAHPDFLALTERLTRALIGSKPDLRQRVTVAVLGAGLAQAGADPRLADIGDATLREELLLIGQTLLRGDYR